VITLHRSVVRIGLVRGCKTLRTELGTKELDTFYHSCFHPEGKNFIKENNSVFRSRSFLLAT
jgi:hypothetical protein